MKYYINLFPAKEKDVVDRALFFAFHYLRYILVITQFVVICVFFFRFKVDQEIVDLKDGLRQKQQIVEATKGLLEEVEYLERKTNQVGDIIKAQDDFQEMFSYFLSGLPPAIILTSVSVERGKISCTGYSLDPAAIRDYERQLQDERRFSEISLTGVRKTDQGFSFSLVLNNYVGTGENG